jgi:hypothetical protein
MKRLEFKKGYSLYRKDVSNAHCLGLDTFKAAINSNKLFRAVYLRDMQPVSIKCKMTLSDAGLYGEDK